ncbi:helix-turn-helix domain-containing protein [Spirosoma foliorum]|uniref:AraC family transcriptional regulator n=1 Tax=Spirosoma foliorum TaxID=2710596 RepID=A0A7G5GWE2_9BACT|nr:helix-turn-helix domain-containing protein [Spirosoma foliorum]QMW03184.1 AraC family transcriptional regulator [Spirosoma foliorum]
MQETTGLLDRLKHHEKLTITVNENCLIELPEEALQKLLQPHKLSYYYFVFMDQGTETVQTDLQDIAISDSQLVFGLPNQIFAHETSKKKNQHYKIGFDENTLKLLPHSYPFLVNPLNSNVITFDPEAKERVKAILSILFQLLHSSRKPIKADIILAHLNTLLTEFNSAYFEKGHYEAWVNPKIEKYIEFKLAVETELTEQQTVDFIAKKLGMTTSSLYAVVKEYSGVSPKEWITNRLIQEAQRQLQYTSVSVKELAYALGFNDPSYFSRLFKKRTGKSVTEFVTGLRDLSSN